MSSAAPCLDSNATTVLKTRCIAGHDIMLEPGYRYVAFQVAFQRFDVTVEIFRVDQLASLETEPAARIEGLTADFAERFIAALREQFDLGLW